MKDSFYGYVRPNGEVGVRNHVLVIPSCRVCNIIANRIAAYAVGVKAVTQKERTIDRRKFHAKNSFSIHSPALSAIASQCRFPQVGGFGSPCRREAA